jgi:hypothetical protein
MGFESTIPAFERAKTVHALDCTTTVNGPEVHNLTQKNLALVHTLNRIKPANIRVPIPLKFILILSSYLLLGPPSDLFLSGFPIQI